MSEEAKIALSMDDFQTISWIMGMFVSLVSHEPETVRRMMEKEQLWGAGMALISSRFSESPEPIGDGKLHKANLQDFMPRLTLWFNTIVKFAAAASGRPMADDEAMEYLSSGSSLVPDDEE